MALSDLANAAPFVLDDVDTLGTGNEDEITVPGANGLTCGTCAAPLTYAGKGRKPRFCDDHKPNRAQGTGKKRAKRVKRGHPFVESIGAGVYGFAGMAVQQSATSDGGVAAARMMQLQSADAGIRIARILDPYTSKMKWLNNVASEGPLADIMALVIPPLLVSVLANNPAAMEMFKPVVMPILMNTAKSILDAQDEQEKTLGTFAEPDEATKSAYNDMIANAFAGLTGANEGTDDGTTSDS